MQFLGEIPPEQFSDLQQIGSGAYSSIFSAIHTQTNVRVALKIVLKTDDIEKMKIIRQELEIHKSLNHPFICKYYTDLETEHLIIISMELIEGVCLIEYVNRKRGLPIQDAQSIFSQLVIAIEYMHIEKNIAHRDLKLDNIMVDNYNHIRLIDFGFSSPKIIMSTMCGSLPYCAPEILKSQNYTKKADIWCLGIILYSIISDQLPFIDSNMNIMIHNICEQEPDYSVIFDGNLRNLISRLLMKDPSHRMTIEEIKYHIFMSHVNFFKIDYKSLFSLNPINPNNQEKKIFINPLKSSSSHLNVPSLSSNSSQLDLVPHKREKPLTTSNQLLISNLKQKVINDTDNIDDLIMSRKDYSSNLNKLIETAFLETSPGNVKTIGSYINLQSNMPTASPFKIPNRRFHRFSHNNVIFHKSPLIAKPF